MPEIARNILQLAFDFASSIFLIISLFRKISIAVALAPRSLETFFKMRILRLHFSAGVVSCFYRGPVGIRGEAVQ
jgi:hypothetical protein